MILSHRWAYFISIALNLSLYLILLFDFLCWCNIDWRIFIFLKWLMCAKIRTITFFPYSIFNRMLFNNWDLLLGIPMTPATWDLTYSQVFLLYIFKSICTFEYLIIIYISSIFTWETSSIRLYLTSFLKYNQLLVVINRSKYAFTPPWLLCEWLPVFSASSIR